jgi:serine/threonine protein kinase
MLETKPRLQIIKNDQFQLLGSGRFGDVYRGTLAVTIDNNRSEITVAIKTPNSRESFRAKEMSEEEIDKILLDERYSLREELTVMTQIGEHSNVLKLLGAATNSEENFCIVTEYCQLGSLDEFLREKNEQDLFVSEICSENCSILAENYRVSRGRVRRMEIMK